MARLTATEISDRLGSVPGWEIIEESTVNKLSRMF